MIAAYEIVKRLYIWFVVAVAVVPRQHVDRTRCSIGGTKTISYPFKRLLIFVAIINFIRMILKDSNIKTKARFLADTLGIIQQFGTGFLCFLTPYILQTWLSPYINVGGRGRRPGESLLLPLYASTLLSIASVVLVRLSSPNWWALRKLGNVVSSPPVLATLQMFDSVTTRGGHHHGRGSILSQSLKVVEWWFLITQVLCAIGFALDPTLVKYGHTGGGSREQENGNYYYNQQWMAVLEGFREIAFVSEWTRILGHALFINQLDELYLSSPGGGGSGSGGTTPTRGGGGNGDMGSSSNNRGTPEDIEMVGGQRSDEIVSLINRRRSSSTTSSDSHDLD